MATVVGHRIRAVVAEPQRMSDFMRGGSRYTDRRCIKDKHRFINRISKAIQVRKPTAFTVVPIFGDDNSRSPLRIRSSRSRQGGSSWILRGHIHLKR